MWTKPTFYLISQRDISSIENIYFITLISLWYFLFLWKKNINKKVFFICFKNLLEKCVVIFDKIEYINTDRHSIIQYRCDITFHIYAFSRHFYPKRLSVHSGYTFFCQYVCSLGIEPTTFALLTQCWATGTYQKSMKVSDLNKTSNIVFFVHIFIFIWSKNSTVQNNWVEIIIVCLKTALQVISQAL